MKRCPVCQSVYADDSLSFCLQDGATLESARPSSSDEFKTWVLPESAAGSGELPPTEVLDIGAAATNRPRQPSPTAPHRPRDTKPITEQAVAGQPGARSTATVVGLTVVVTIALLGLGGIGAWFLLGDKKESAQRSDSPGNVNVTRSIDNQSNTLPNSNTRPVNTPTPTSTPTPAATATPTPAATPTPTTSLSAEESAVRTALNGWLYSFRARDIDSYMAHYAGTLEAYYLARNVSAVRVRGDKERAFAKYTSIDVRLSNMQVQVDPSGQRAVATFTKSYVFTGPGVSPYTGSGLNRFTFRKIGGAWLIVGEEDLSG